MLFKMLYDDNLAQAAYLIGCQRTGDAILIDPERDIDRYTEAAAREGMRITAVTETHIHADYLSGARQLAEETGAKLYLSDEGDADWKYQWVDKKSDGGSYDCRLVKHGDKFEIGYIRFEVLHTPGHTPEHICFLVTDVGGGATEPMGLASGDFVFVGDVGRPDLLETAAGVSGAKEDSARRMYESLQLFKELPDYLQLWPGHGSGSACGKALGAVPQSTVGYEKRFNESIAEAYEETNFVSEILDGQQDPPLYFARMKQENKEGPAVLSEFPSPQILSAAVAKEHISNGCSLLDTRPWNLFAAHHFKGSLFTPLNKTFPTIAGSYVDPESDIILVVDENKLETAIRNLIRVGLDRIAGFITPEQLDAFASENGDLESTRCENIEVLHDRTGDPEMFILDVRAEMEHELGNIPGAYNVTHTRLFGHLDEIPRDKEIMVHCRSGARSQYATALLQAHGFNAVQMDGGFLAWVRSGTN